MAHGKTTGFSHLPFAVQNAFSASFSSQIRRLLAGSPRQASNTTSFVSCLTSVAPVPTASAGGERIGGAETRRL
jgi:hypothetical protein